MHGALPAEPGRPGSRRCPDGLRHVGEAAGASGAQAVTAPGPPPAAPARGGPGPRPTAAGITHERSPKPGHSLSPRRPAAGGLGAAAGLGGAARSPTWASPFPGARAGGRRGYALAATCCWIFPSSVTTQCVVAKAPRAATLSRAERLRSQPGPEPGGSANRPRGPPAAAILRPRPGGWPRKRKRAPAARHVGEVGAGGGGGGGAGPAAGFRSETALLWLFPARGAAPRRGSPRGLGVGGAPAGRSASVCGARRACMRA